MRFQTGRLGIAWHEYSMLAEEWPQQIQIKSNTVDLINQEYLNRVAAKVGKDLKKVVILKLIEHAIHASIHTCGSFSTEHAMKVR